MLEINMSVSSAQATQISGVTTAAGVIVSLRGTRQKHVRQAPRNTGSRGLVKTIAVQLMRVSDEVGDPNA